MIPHWFKDSGALGYSCCVEDGKVQGVEYSRAEMGFIASGLFGQLFISLKGIETPGS